MIGMGRRVYGLGAILLGVVQLAYGGFSPDWLPVSPHTPDYGLLVNASGGLLVLAGLAINPRRTEALGALGLTTIFALGALVAEAPHVLAKPLAWGGWQAVAESTAMALGGVLVYARTQSAGPGRATAIIRGARLAFGVCLLVFGGSHFVYAKFTASLAPAWLPPSQIFWAYATGVAQIAAGLAMLSGVQALPVAILLTVMYVIFGILVHAPSIVADPSSQANWTENGVNLLLVGAAWAMADALWKPRARR